MKKISRSTARLQIRPLELMDFDKWKTAHLTMAKSKNTWDYGPKSSDQLTKRNFKKIISLQEKRRRMDTFYDFGVFDKSGTFVGIVSAMEVSRGISHTAFLGYRIFNTHWNRGFGKEAVRAMLDIAFQDLKLHRIEAGIEPKNLRSIRLAKSLRMRREGIKRRAVFLRNQWVDLVMYSLTTEDIGIKFDTASLKPKSRI